MFKKKVLTLVLLFFTITFNGFCLASTDTEILYPDYVYEFLGEDKYEKFNRKMFNFNMKMNKYALRPLHIIWASIMPKYGMDRIQGIYENVLYPRRLVSSLIQRDFEGAKDETIRFLTNTTLGLGGMFDPAKKFFNIESTDADMEQALAKCKIKSGPYLVCPILSSSSPRALAGKALDAALDPSSYLGIPFMSLVKLGFTLNNTSYMQPMSYLIEATYADPYDIMRKLYGLENYLKTTPVIEEANEQTLLEVYKEEVNGEVIAMNFEDEILVSDTLTAKNLQNENTKDSSAIIISKNNAYPEANIIELTNKNDSKWDSSDDIFAQKLLALYGYTSLLEEEYLVNNFEKLALNDGSQQTPETPLQADILLEGYNPQNPVVDAMRTALFDLPEITKSIWSEMSIWNRSFYNRIKTSSVNLFKDRANYKFRFIMQKDKNAPVVIIYPSIGEGIMSNHSVVLAKLFYDKGYSAIIIGSHFQWAFAKSMPEDYRPGLPAKDTEYIQILTSKIINQLQDKYKCKFRDKTVIGTSFGAMTTLFLADKEYKENTLDISKFISINPPIELIYSMTQIDKNTAEWNLNPDNLKEKVALTAAKVLHLLQAEDVDKQKLEALPFSEEEAKLITGFIMHQKLSDLIFTIENKKDTNYAELYKMIRNMNYKEYAKKYLLNDTYATVEDLETDASLHCISDYLRNNNNYKIYHALDDYLVNSNQLAKLKDYCKDNLVLMNNGSHLGFLYRKEFIETLKQEITLNDDFEILNTKGEL